MLAVHVDAGWNSNIAVSNIEKLVKHCDRDLHTSVVDWQSIQVLQVAYLESGISNQDVPQDHVFFATLCILLVYFLVVRQLSHCLKRRTSVNHLYQAASLVISPTNPQAYDCLQTVIFFFSLQRNLIGSC